MADGICGVLLIPFISHKENYEDNFHRCIQESNAGLPVTCAIDMMDSDGNSLYFLTAKGKSFYERLKKKAVLFQMSAEVY